MQVTRPTTPSGPNRRGLRPLRMLHGGALLLALVLTAGGGVQAQEPARPAVLFLGGTHSQYVVQPLHEMGIEVDTCGAEQAAERLATGKYNVVVPYVQYDVKYRKVIEDFLAQGGGVFLTLPIGHLGVKPMTEWFPSPQWAAEMGARLRWETLSDDDPANVATDLLGCTFSWSDQVSPPVNEGVRGVLTLVARVGWWPPLAIDFGPEWEVVVRGASSMKTSPAETIPEQLRPYIPGKAPTGSPALMGVREVGKGRMSLVCFTPPWSFNSPGICPTVEAMLTAGAGGKPSDWLRVFANTFRWLAEPSLKAGMGGATTPDGLLNPGSKWGDCALVEWEKPRPHAFVPPMSDQPQVQGLVGARTSLSSGTGTVADYAKAAKAAGLDFIIFLEDSLKMDAKKYDALVAQCAAASDDTFAAIPGLTYEDAQGNHMFTLGDNTKLPNPEILLPGGGKMVLPDGRLNTTLVSRTEAVFKYLFEYQSWRNVLGFWRHQENFLPVADYKLYNSFPIYSFEDGKLVDDAFDDYLYLMGWGGCHLIFAFEIMTGPEQVATRAKEGWRTVSSIPVEMADGTYLQTLPPGVKGLRQKYIEALGWRPPYQYITNGPQILSWSPQNNCVIPSGEWWRPDLWEYRAHLHVAADAGLKTVTIYDGDRGIFRRWLSTGNDFQADLVLANCQQRDLTLVVEDIKGRRAIGMEIWNRNTLLDQFICGDRANFLGRSWNRRKDGIAFTTPIGFRQNMGVTPSKGSMGEGLWVQPATALTPGAPTIPIDGAPTSWPTNQLSIEHSIPGEYREVFAYPSVYMVSPEIAVGQADYRLAYDPAEYGAKQTPLGHPYEQPDEQGNIGKNAWTSWYRLIPTKIVSGWSRIYACNTLGNSQDLVRLGWYEAHLVMKEEVALTPEQGISVMECSGGWEVYAGGQVVASLEEGKASGKFGRGVFALLMNPGGSILLCGTDNRLHYSLQGDALRLSYHPDDERVAKGQVVDISVAWMGTSGTLPKEQLLALAQALGVANPGTTGYAPNLSRGKTLDNYLLWRVDGQGIGLDGKVPRANMNAFLPLAVEGLNDNWSVFLLDRARKGPNFRALPIRDGRAFAQLDLTDGDSDLFVGHPLTCDNKEVRLLVSWQQPGMWFVEAHNATEKAVTTKLTTSPGWTPFTLNETVLLAPGTSKVWRVKENVG